MEVEAKFKAFVYTHQIGQRVFVKQLHSTRNFCFEVQNVEGDLLVSAVDEYGVRVGPFTIPQSELTYVIPDGHFFVKDSYNFSGMAEVMQAAGIVEILDHEEEKFAHCRLIPGGPYKYIGR